MKANPGRIGDHPSTYSDPIGDHYRISCVNMNKLKNMPSAKFAPLLACHTLATALLTLSDPSKIGAIRGTVHIVLCMIERNAANDKARLLCV